MSELYRIEINAISRLMADGIMFSRSSSIKSRRMFSVKTGQTRLNDHIYDTVRKSLKHNSTQLIKNFWIRKDIGNGVIIVSFCL